MDELSEIIKEFIIYPTPQMTQKISNLRVEIEEKINKILGGVFPNKQKLWIDNDTSDKTREITSKVKIKIAIKVKKLSLEDVRKGLNELEVEIIEKYSY